MRKARNPKLDTRNARAKNCQKRRNPYWTTLGPGRALGYRKGSRGGYWIARLRDESGRQHHQSLGQTDDLLDADGVDVLSFAQAQEKAVEWFQQAARELLDHDYIQRGPYTVKDAIDDYLAWFEKRRKSYVQTKNVCDYAILPRLGHTELSRLTKRKIGKWHQELAESAAKLRSPRNSEKLNTRSIDSEEEARRRKSSANRALTVLKAALNHAYHEGKIASDDAWRKVKPYKNVESAKVRYLSEAEIMRLLNATSGTFRHLVAAALLTGARYGELRELRASDFDAEAKTLFIKESKSGKAHHIALTDEGTQFFERLTMGKAGNDLVLVKDDGTPWKPSEQRRPILAACKAAHIEPAIGFHILRHTYASRLAMRGVPFAVIAAQLGHSDTRMVEKHYGHIAPSFVADTVRAAMKEIGIGPDNVTRLPGHPPQASMNGAGRTGSSPITSILPRGKRFPLRPSGNGGKVRKR